ncbi:hypothetical protein BC828DRAFT_425022 [Blastocladiella britannica]|nr:hypothetical protein BC828DRAFT_425022 [Blastocladiella britannica]
MAMAKPTIMPRALALARSQRPRLLMRRSIATTSAPRQSQPLQHPLGVPPPQFQILRPVTYARTRREYTRSRSAAVGVLLRHFRQPDIVRPEVEIDRDVVQVINHLGYTRPWVGETDDASIAWVYDFRTVESILAFLDERSNAQFWFNGLSLASVVAGAFITLYYNEMSKIREERRLAEEAVLLEEQRLADQARERWDELYDVAIAAPGAEPLCPIPMSARLSNAAVGDGVTAEEEPIECRDDARVNDMLSLISGDPRGGSPFFTMLVAPAGAGKSGVLKRVFNLVLDSVEGRAAAAAAAATDAHGESSVAASSDNATTSSLDAVYYVDFKDAFKRNTADVADAQKKFLDFLDHVQERSAAGDQIAVFVDGADCLPTVFGASTPAIMRHIHETGAYAHMVVAANSYTAYRELLPESLRNQHAVVAMPYVSDRAALLVYVRALHHRCEAAGLGHRWNVDDEAVVEVVGGNFDDYARLMRAVTRGRESVTDALAELLADSQDRVERALGLQAASSPAITPDAATAAATSHSALLAPAFLHAAEAVTSGTPHAVYLPRPAQSLLRESALMYRTAAAGGAHRDDLQAAQRSEWQFWYPRDRVVAAWVIQHKAYSRPLAKVRAAAKVLVDSVEGAAADDDVAGGGIGRKIVVTVQERVERERRDKSRWWWLCYLGKTAKCQPLVLTARKFCWRQYSPRGSLSLCDCWFVRSSPKPLFRKGTAETEAELHKDMSARPPLAERLAGAVKSATSSPTPSRQPSTDSLLLTTTSTTSAQMTVAAVPVQQQQEQPSPVIVAKMYSPTSTVSTSALAAAATAIMADTQAPPYHHEDDDDDDTPLVITLADALSGDVPEPTAEVVTELRVQLQQGRLREMQLQRAVDALETELGRAQSQSVAFHSAVREMSRLRENMADMTAQLREEEERNNEMETVRRAMDAEYESLSAVLFDQANNMVKEQSMLRAHAERRAFMAEQRQRDSEGVVESLRIEMAGLKQLLESATDAASTHAALSDHDDGGGDDADFIADREMAAAETVRATSAGEEWRTDAFPMEVVPPVLAQAPGADNTPTSYSALTVPGLSAPPAHRRGSSVTSFDFGSGRRASVASVSAATAAVAALHPILATEFSKFLHVLFAPVGRGTHYLTVHDRENALYRTRFMERLFEEDIKPTLSFPALSWLQKKSVAGAVSSHTVAIMPRRTPILVKRKPKTSATSATASAAAAKATEAAKKWVPVALSTLGAAGAMSAAFSGPNASNSSSGTNSPAHGESPSTRLHSQYEPLPSSALESQSEHPSAPPVPEEPAEYAPDTIDCWGCGTRLVNVPPLTVVSLSDSDTPKPVCKLCRGKLVAACHVFAYLRRLSAGIVPPTASSKPASARTHGRSASVTSGFSDATPTAVAGGGDGASLHGPADDALVSGHGDVPPVPPIPAIMATPSPYAPTSTTTTTTSAFFSKLSSVTSNLSSRMAAANAGSSPSTSSTAGAGSSSVSATGTPPSTTTASVSASSSLAALGASFWGTSHDSVPSRGATPTSDAAGGSSGATGSGSPPLGANAAAAAASLEPTIPLTPELVGALWADLCRLRQRMFLARLAVSYAGNADLFDSHPIVHRAVETRDTKPAVVAAAAAAADHSTAVAVTSTSVPEAMVPSAERPPSVVVVPTSPEMAEAQIAIKSARLDDSSA